MTTHFKTILLTVGVLLGIVIGKSSDYSSEVAVGAVSLMILQSVIMLVGKWRGAKSTAPFLFVLFSLGLFLGIVRVQLVEEKTNYICGESCTYEAKIVSSPESKNDYQIFNVHPIDESDEVLDVQVRVPLYPKHEIGETLKITGKIFEPEAIVSHGENKSFDYASYLLNKNVGSEMIFPKVETIDQSAHGLNDRLGRLKENMNSRINVYVSSPASYLASGMLFGNSSMSKELTQTFRVAGLSHIIVLSGFNIAIVISFILFVFAFLPFSLRILLAAVSVIFFVTMVGGEASVIRATLMAFIALLAKFIGKEYVAKQALLVSLLLIVFYEPYSLMTDASLHLSFLATAGIVYLSEPISSVLKKYFSFISSETFLALITTTLSAYIITFPYIVYSFGFISAYALLANILVLPFVPIAMFVSFLVVSSSYVSAVMAAGFGFVATSIINLMIWIAQTIESLPYSYLMLQITFTGMCIMYLFVAVMMSFLLMKKENETKSTTINGFLTDTIQY